MRPVLQIGASCDLGTNGRDYDIHVYTDCHFIHWCSGVRPITAERSDWKWPVKWVETTGDAWQDRCKLIYHSLKNYRRTNHTISIYNTLRQKVRERYTSLHYLSFKSNILSPQSSWTILLSSWTVPLSSWTVPLSSWTKWRISIRSFLGGVSCPVEK